MGGVSMRRGRGFTLVELLVVLSILGILSGLLLSGVQRVREASRRMSCSNNLRQQGIGIQTYHSAWGTFPAGMETWNNTRHSWCTQILPSIGGDTLAPQIDKYSAWVSPQNWKSTSLPLSTMRCPSGIVEYPGDTDYVGMMGSILSGDGHDSRGVLVAVNTHQLSPVGVRDIIDGTSNTIAIAESADQLPEAHGMWADGMHCIFHDNGPVNSDEGGEIYSRHPAGAMVCLADGSVRFLAETLDTYIIGSLCTRAGGEVVSIP